MIDTETEEKLKKINISKLDNIKLECVLNTVELSMTDSSLHMLLSVIKNSLFERNTVKEGSGPEAFLFSSDYGERADHFVRFQKVIGLFPDATVITPKKSLKLSNLRFIPTFFSFLHTISRFFSKDEAIYLSSVLYLTYLEACAIAEKLERIGIEKLIVFCDIHPIDCLLVQLCKSLGIKTVTLQHGHYAYGSPAFIYSVSDFFLGFGQYTYLVAQRSGFDMNKFKSAGMMDLIDEALPNRINILDTKTFAVMLSGMIEEDVALLTITEDLCKTGYVKRLIKLHPRSKIEDYKYQWNDSDIIIGDKSALWIMKNTDFSVVAGGSTVFTEGVIHLCPTFLFDYHATRMQGLNCQRFSNIAELNSILERLKTDIKTIEKEMIETREAITETENINVKYIDIIQSI